MDDRVELTEDVRKKLLGQYFVYSDYRSGDIIRVVGFTKKKVIIEQVPQEFSPEERETQKAGDPCVFRIERAYLSTPFTPRTTGRQVYVKQIDEGNGKVLYTIEWGQKYALSPIYFYNPERPIDPLTYKRTSGFD